MGTEADLKLTLLCFTLVYYIYLGNALLPSSILIIAILCHFLSEKIVKYPLPGKMV